MSHRHRNAVVQLVLAQLFYGVCVIALERCLHCKQYYVWVVVELFVHAFEQGEAARMASGAPVLEKIEIDNFAAQFTEANGRDMTTVAIDPVV